MQGRIVVPLRYIERANVYRGLLMILLWSRYAASDPLQPYKQDQAKERFFYLFLFMHFSPGTMTTHAESINSDLQGGVDRRLRPTALNTEQNQLAISGQLILPQRWWLESINS